MCIGSKPPDTATTFGLDLLVIYLIVIRLKYQGATLRLKSQYIPTSGGQNLQNELPSLINHSTTSILQVSRHNAVGRRDDVGVHGGIIESKCLGLWLRKLRDVARVCVIVTHAECYVGIA